MEKLGRQVEGCQSRQSTTGSGSENRESYEAVPGTGRLPPPFCRSTGEGWSCDHVSELTFDCAVLESNQHIQSC